MAKRFVDTDIWTKSWYQELTLKEKILVKYIFEQCDCAGVWDINFRLASFIIGEKVDMSDIENINKRNLLFEIFDSDKIFVIDFIKFQYGNLSENCKPHKPIILKLKKYGLFERVSKGYPKGIETLEEKEKEKEKEQYKEKEQLIEKEKIKKIDPYINPVVNEYKNQHEKIIGTRLYLNNAECNKLIELSSCIEDFTSTIPQVFKKLKKLKFDGIDYKPNASWLLKDNHYTEILNGAYDTDTESMEDWYKRKKEEIKNGRKHS